jgi:hypothetical protein
MAAAVGETKWAPAGEKRLQDIESKANPTIIMGSGCLIDFSSL